MSKTKEQMAAVLLNHWYVIRRAIEIGRLKKPPTSARYKDLLSLNYTDTETVEKIRTSFANFNSKSFVDNIKYELWKLEEKLSVKFTWHERILVSGLGGVLAGDIAWAEAQALLRAMSFSRQAELTNAVLSTAPSVTAQGADQKAGWNITIPSHKRNPYVSMALEEPAHLTELIRRAEALHILVTTHAHLTDSDKVEVSNARCNIMATFVREDGQLKYVSHSVEETDAARASRLARERLEALRRQRMTLVNSVQEENNVITYGVNLASAPEQAGQLQIAVDNILGW